MYTYFFPRVKRWCQQQQVAPPPGKTSRKWCFFFLVKISQLPDREQENIYHSRDRPELDFPPSFYYYNIRSSCGPGQNLHLQYAIPCPPPPAMVQKFITTVSRACACRFSRLSDIFSSQMPACILDSRQKPNSRGAHNIICPDMVVLSAPRPSIRRKQASGALFFQPQINPLNPL